MGGTAVVGAFSPRQGPDGRRGPVLESQYPWDTSGACSSRNTDTGGDAPFPCEVPSGPVSCAGETGASRKTSSWSGGTSVLELDGGEGGMTL